MLHSWLHVKKKSRKFKNKGREKNKSKSDLCGQGEQNIRWRRKEAEIYKANNLTKQHLVKTTKLFYELLTFLSMKKIPKTASIETECLMIFCRNNL